MRLYVHALASVAASVTSLAVTCAAHCSHVVTRFVYVTVNDYYCSYRTLALSVMLGSSLQDKYTVVYIVEDSNTELGKWEVIDRAHYAGTNKEITVFLIHSSLYVGFRSRGSDSRCRLNTTV